MHTEDIDEFLAQTHASSPSQRRKALAALCPCHVKANHDRVWDRVLAMTTDSDPSVRRQVLHTLCDGSPHTRFADIFGAIEHLAQDEDSKLRKRARWVLNQYRLHGKINVL